MNIVNALKQTKSRKNSKSDLASNNFDNIEVQDVKYLPSFFDGVVLFVLPLVSFGVPSAYGHLMNDMDKICNGDLWYTTKPQISKTILDYLSGVLLVQIIFNALMNFMIICIAMRASATIPNGPDQLLPHSL